MGWRSGLYRQSHAGERISADTVSAWSRPAAWLRGWIFLNQSCPMVPTVNSFILQQKLPDAQLMLFPDSGHGSHFQFPEEFAEAAVRFLAAA